MVQSRGRRGSRLLYRIRLNTFVSFSARVERIMGRPIMEKRAEPSDKTFHGSTNHGSQTPRRREPPLEPINPPAAPKRTPTTMAKTRTICTICSTGLFHINHPATMKSIDGNLCGTVLHGRLRERVGNRQRTPASGRIWNEATLSISTAKENPLARDYTKLDPKFACHCIEPHGRSSLLEPATRKCPVEDKCLHLRTA